MTIAPMMPFVPILIALRGEIAAALNGRKMRGKTIGVRHHRHRDAGESERPSVAIRLMSNDVSQLGQERTSQGDPEQMMELAINLVIDLDLAPENDSYDDESGDPTGFGDFAYITKWILDRLLPDLVENGDERNTLGGLVWDIRYDGSAPEEGDASPDYARMEERLTLFYRVRSDHPSELLTEQ